MVNAILPERLDNVYHGRRLALWLFVVVLVMKTGIALGTIFNGRGAAQSADGLPLDSFGAGGAEAVLALFALWGLSQLALSVFGVVALARYRAMIPLMYLVLLVEQLSRKWVLFIKPIARTGTHPGTYINLGLLLLMAIGLGLSLWRRADARVQLSGSTSAGTA